MVYCSGTFGTVGTIGNPLSLLSPSSLSPTVRSPPFSYPPYLPSGAGSGMAGMAAPYQSAEIWVVDFQENQ